MKYKLSLLVTFFFLLAATARAQVGIGTKTPHASASLDITANDKGVLVPRVALRDVSDSYPIAVSPATGLLVFNTAADAKGGKGVGFYYWGGGTTGSSADRWIFIGGADAAEIVNNPLFKDVVVNLIGKAGKAINSPSGKLLVTGGDSSVLSPVQIDLDVKALLADTTFRDSVANMIQNNTNDRIDSVGKRGFIALYDVDGKSIDRSDSSVFKHFKIGVDGKIFRDSTSQVMVDSLASPRVKEVLARTIFSAPVRDSVLSVVRNSPVSANVKVITDADYKVENNDYVIIVNGMTQTHTIDLPDAAGNANRMLIINQFTPTQTLRFNTKVIYSDTVQADELLSTIGGGTGGTLKVTLISDGKKWYVISYTA
ncbi:hypothetical protein HF329_15035 [Chitinophaga oryzae]|uniref:Uncharacterized protein n=1 Tax=Chitinophaga oryzae TaxID=2725414 RepID=A0AAE7D7S5_9BACT|nr:hypothetical protein [Chitinophaga oryzae]QJB32566.1 hypothetical protein HF329_15035 [Chitinophaga oryzae]